MKQDIGRVRKGMTATTTMTSRHEQTNDAAATVVAIERKYAASIANSAPDLGKNDRC